MSLNNYNKSIHPQFEVKPTVEQVNKFTFLSSEHSLAKYKED